MWLGGRFRLGLPVVPINGFAIYNMGDRQDFGNVPTFHHDGVALKLEAGAVPVGPGKVSCQALYSTGGDTPGGGFRTVAQSAATTSVPRATGATSCSSRPKATPT